MSNPPPLAPPNNSTALAALVLGIVSAGLAFTVVFLFGQPTGGTMILGFALASLPALLAVIFGFVGLSTANRLGGKRRKYAVVGIVLGFTPWLFALLGAFLKSAVLG